MGRGFTDSRVEKMQQTQSRFLSVFALSPAGRPAPTGPSGRPLPLGGRCASRLENALDQIKRRQLQKARNLDTPIQMIDLDGYTLQQHLRTAPVNMYVTRMRVRLPQNQNWVRVERCHFDPRNISLETRLLFNDLTISGSVNLNTGHGDLEKSENVRDYDMDTFYENRDFEGNIRYRRDNVDDIDSYKSRDEYYDRGRRDCNMILRLRKAGIGFFTQPLNQSPGRFSVKTDSEFIEPGFISVYAYGCERYITQNRFDYDRNLQDDEADKNNLDKRYKRQMDRFKFDSYEGRGDNRYPRRSSRRWERQDINNYRMEKSKLFGPDDRLEDFDYISREMEDVFTKGIRSLLTTYMQKELQPAIKETLMRNLGYTISYGK